jgi:hypothetical protein
MQGQTENKKRDAGQNESFHAYSNSRFSVFSAMLSPLDQPGVNNIGNLFATLY